MAPSSPVLFGPSRVMLGGSVRIEPVSKGIHTIAQKGKVSVMD